MKKGSWMGFRVRRWRFDRLSTWNIALIFIAFINFSTKYIHNITLCTFTLLDEMTLISTQKFNKTTKNMWERKSLNWKDVVEDVKDVEAEAAVAACTFCALWKKRKHFQFEQKFSTFFTTQFTSFPWCRKHTTKIHREIYIQVR